MARSTTMWVVEPSHRSRSVRRTMNRVVKTEDRTLGETDVRADDQLVIEARGRLVPDDGFDHAGQAAAFLFHGAVGEGQAGACARCVQLQTRRGSWRSRQRPSGRFQRSGRDNSIDSEVIPLRIAGIFVSVCSAVAAFQDLRRVRPGRASLLLFPRARLVRVHLPVRRCPARERRAEVRHETLRVFIGSPSMFG